MGDFILPHCQVPNHLRDPLSGITQGRTSHLHNRLIHTFQAVLPLAEVLDQHEVAACRVHDGKKKRLTIRRDRHPVRPGFLDSPQRLGFPGSEIEEID